MAIMAGKCTKYIKILHQLRCLSGSSTVYTRQRGPIQLKDLKLKDTVLTFTPGVGTHFTEVSFTPKKNHISPG